MTGIVEILRTGEEDGVAVLEVSDVLDAAAGGEDNDGRCKKEDVRWKM